MRARQAVAVAAMLTIVGAAAPVARAATAAAGAGGATSLATMQLAPPAPGQGRTAQYATGDVLVRFRPGVATAQQAKSLRSAKASASARTLPGGYTSATVTGGVAASIAVLRKDPSVQWAGYDFVRRTTAQPNDPYVGRFQPYLVTINASRAWDVSTGSLSQVVAVLDTGVDATHPDLAGRVLPGYDFVNNDANAADDNGHGTFVAGVAAANTNNGIGIAGVAWTARILPVKVLNAAGLGTDSEVAAGIAWAADHGATVINLSLAGAGDDPVLHAAVQYAVGKGIPVVAAAGNTGDTTAQYPAAYPEAIAVGATDLQGGLAAFSTHGDWVDLAAPGVAITSTYPGGRYATGSGTSFAAPIVSGGIVLVRAAHPTWTVAQVTSDLERSANDAGVAAGWDPYFGFGIPDLGAALGDVRQPSFFVKAANAPTPASAGYFPFGVGQDVSGGLGTSTWEKADFTSDTAVTVDLVPYPAAPEMTGQMVVSAYDSQRRLIGTAAASAPGASVSLSLTMPAGTDFFSASNLNSTFADARMTVTQSGAVAPVTPGLPTWVESYYGTAAPFGETILFDRDMNPSTLTGQQVVARSGITGDPIAASVAYDSATRTLTVQASAPVPEGAPFDVFVLGARDLAGNTLPEYYAVSLMPEGPGAAVSSLSAVGGIGAVSLSWDLPPEWIMAVLSRYAVGTTPPVDPTSGTLLHYGFGTTASVSGLKPGTDYAFSVWANGGPASAVVSGTTIAMSVAPGAVAYGAPVTSTATVTDATTRAALPGRTATIYWRVVGSTTWDVLRSATTDANGQVSAVSSPRYDVQYEAVASGGVGRMGAVTSVGTVPVSYFIPSRLSTLAPALGQTVIWSGSLLPLRVGHPVYLQDRYHAAWHTIATVLVPTTGRFALAIRPPARGVFGYRLFTPADAYNAAGAVQVVITVH